MIIEAENGLAGEKFNMDFRELQIKRKIRVYALGGKNWDIETKPGISVEELAENIANKGLVNTLLNVLFLRSFYEATGFIVTTEPRKRSPLESLKLSQQFNFSPAVFIDGLVYTAEEAFAKFAAHENLFETQLSANTIKWMLDNGHEKIVKPRAKLWRSEVNWYQMKEGDTVVYANAYQS